MTDLDETMEKIVRKKQNYRFVKQTTNNSDIEHDLPEIAPDDAQSELEVDSDQDDKVTHSINHDESVRRNHETGETHRVKYPGILIVSEDDVNDYNEQDDDEYDDGTYGREHYGSGAYGRYSNNSYDGRKCYRCGEPGHVVRKAPLIPSTLEFYLHDLGECPEPPSSSQVSPDMTMKSHLGVQTRWHSKIHQ